MRPLPLALVVLLTTATAHAEPATPLSLLQRGPEAQALRDRLEQWLSAKGTASEGATACRCS